MPNITSFPTGNVGIGTDNPQRNLHVAGTMRLTGSTGTGSTAIMGRDGSGDIGNVGVGTGLQLTNGTLSLTGATGTGTTNYLSKWASATGLTDSIVLETGNTIDIAGSLRVRTSSGTATSVMGRDVNGYVSNITTGAGLQISNGTLSLTGATGTGTTGIVPRWASSSGLTDSIIFSTGTVVGINTTNPQATLDVRGTMRLTGSTGSPVTAIMGRNANGDISNATIGTGLQLTNGTLSLTGATGTGTTNYLTKWSSATGLTDSIVLETGNTIDIAGSLRVRTSSGTATAVMGRDINGYVSNIAVGSGLSVSGGTLSTTGVTFGTGADGRVAYWIGTGVTNQIGNDNNFIWDYENDRLGIGVFPTSALHISSADSASIRIVKTGTSPADFSLVALNGKLDIGSAFTITDTGRLGLGTNAPAQTLDVAGNMRLTGSTGTSTTVMGRSVDGDISAISVGSGLSLSGNVLTTTGGTFGTVTGTGTVNYLSKWASSTGLTNSIALETGNTVDIAGALRVTTASGTATLIAGQNINGYFSRITVGSGLSLSGNVLTTTGGGGNVSGSGTATQVAFWNGTTSLTGNTNLYWDNNNNRLGIGTSSPSNQLTTTSDASISTLTIGLGNNSIANNTAIGVNALVNNAATLASGNTAVGYFTLSSTTAGGSFNSAFGNLALSKTTTGNSNTAVGSNTLTDNTTGNSNTAIGRAALSNNTSGGSNVAVGASALSNNGSGSSSVAVGASAGSLSAAGTNLTTATSSIFIGASSRASNISPSNQIVIGTSAVGLADNATVIGTTGTTQTHLYGNLSLGLTSADTTARVKATSSDGLSSSFAAKFQNSSGTDILSVRGDGVVGIGTISPTARLYVKGSTSGSGSTAFEVTDNTDRDIINVRDDGRITLGRNLASAVQSSVTIEAVGSETNIGIAIVPKGNGAITAAIPNNSSTGGNARGQYAVDLQTYRGSQTEVASGDYSAIVGGGNNRVTGNYSGILAGFNNLVSSDNSYIIGGVNSIASGNTSIILGGSENRSNGIFSSVVGGWGAKSYLYGQVTSSSGFIVTYGDAQTSNIRLRREITGSGQTELFLDGSSARALLTDTNKVWLANIFVVATVKSIGSGVPYEGAVGDTFAEAYIATIKKIGNTTSLVGSVHTENTMSDALMTTSVVSIDANDSNDSLRIRFTPPSNLGNSSVTRVVATVYLTEVGF